MVSEGSEVKGREGRVRGAPVWMPMRSWSSWPTRIWCACSAALRWSAIEAISAACASPLLRASSVPCADGGGGERALQARVNENVNLYVTE